MSSLLLQCVNLLLRWGPPVLPATDAVAEDAPKEAEAAATPVQRPSALVDPAPVIDPTAPSATYEDVPAAAGTVAPASPDPFVASPTDAEDPLRDDVPSGRWVHVAPPTHRGTGLFVGSAALFAATGIFQLGDLLLCGGCAIGGVEHLFLSGSFALAGGGGHVRGGHDAYYDAALQRSRDSRRSMLAGIGLLSAGLALMIANDAMWFSCAVNGEGPYANAGSNCRWFTARGVMDVSAIAVATGLALTTRGARIRRDRAIYARARIVAAPVLQRRGVGLSLGVRF